MRGWAVCSSTLLRRLTTSGCTPSSAPLRPSHRTSTIRTISPPRESPAIVARSCGSLRRSSTRMCGTLTKPHSTGMSFQTSDSSAPGNKIGMRALRRPATTKLSVVSVSRCTTILAARDGCLLRISRRSRNGTCSFPEGGACSSATSASTGGRSGGSGKRLVAVGPYVPSGRILCSV